jgi:hypothetical protein
MRCCTSLAACVLLAPEALGCGEVVAQPIGFASGDGGVRLDAGLGRELGFGPQRGFGLQRRHGKHGLSAPDRGPIPLAGRSACIGDLADVFRFAACACKSFDVSGSLSTDSFDSTSDGGARERRLRFDRFPTARSPRARCSRLAGRYGPAARDPDGGPAVTLNGGVSAGGTIANDVHSAADMQVGGKYLVDGDLWANGNVIVEPGGSLAVLGTLYVPAGDSTSDVQAPVVNAQVPVTAPCSCATPIDVSAVVAAYANANDDSSIGLAADAPLKGTLSLPCGLYYVPAIAGDAVNLQVAGRVALFVAGDISVTQDLRIELAAGAEVDLFVAGNVSIMGGFEIGDADSPARTRVYVGGTTLALAANANPLAANIYAPNAVLELASNFEMWGVSLGGPPATLRQLCAPLRHFSAAGRGGLRLRPVGGLLPELWRLRRSHARVQGGDLQPLRDDRRLLRAAEVRRQRPVRARDSIEARPVLLILRAIARQNSSLVRRSCGRGRAFPCSMRNQPWITLFRGRAQRVQ